MHIINKNATGMNKMDYVTVHVIFLILHVSRNGDRQRLKTAKLLIRPLSGPMVYQRVHT